MICGPNHFMFMIPISEAERKTRFVFFSSPPLSFSYIFFLLSFALYFIQVSSCLIVFCLLFCLFFLSYKFLIVHLLSLLLLFQGSSHSSIPCLLLCLFSIPLRSLLLLSRVHATLQLALSVCPSVLWSVCWSVGNTLLFWRLQAVWGLQLLPNCLAGLFHHCPFSPARDLGSCVSGLVS